MMAGMGKNLPPGVFIKHGRFYRVRADGTKRVWVPLTRERDGLPALYSALAALMSKALPDDRMPALVAAWQADVMARHSEKTQASERIYCRVVAESFSDFRVDQVTAPDVAEFLSALRDRPRTHNLYRALIRELMRYAVEKGLRTDNPVSGVIRTMTEKPRTRYITDSELRRIKVGGIYGDDRKLTRSGLMLAALVDMAYLTGQDIGALLKLRWARDPDSPDDPHVADGGLFFRRPKVEGVTGASVLIEWSPRLKDAVSRLRALHAARQLKKRADQRVVSGYLFTTQAGTPLTYSGASTAWKRAVKRAGIKGVMFRDIRAKALTDKEAREGMQAARQMGAHSTEAQTADYVRRKWTPKTGATR